MFERRTTTIMMALAVGALLWLSGPAMAGETLDLRGSVLDYEGRAVADAEVIVYHEYDRDPQGRRIWSPLAQVATGPNGRFRIDGRIESWTWDHKLWVVAQKESLALAWTLSGLKSSVLLQLGRPQPLGGTVTDYTGRPVAGAVVRLCLKNEPMAGHPYRTRELFLPGDEPWHVTKTDDTGRFRFDNIPLDTTADFRIDAPGRAPIWTFTNSPLAEAEQYPVGQTDIEITLPAPTRIEGQVIDEETGTPVTGLAVLARPHEWTGRDYYNAPAPVDANGYFILNDLKPGAYILQTVAIEGAEQKWFDNAPVVTTYEGQALRGVVLKVNPGATLELVVRDLKSDMLIDEVQVTVRSGLYTRDVATDANGCISVRLPAGKHELRAIKQGHAMLAPGNSVTLGQGQVCREEVLLDCWATRFSGTVVNGDGRPQANAAIRLWASSNCGATDANGLFEHEYYTTGKGSKRRVGARHEASGTTGLATLTDSDGDRRLTGQIILRPAHAVTGRVIDPNGKPLVGARVDLFLGKEGNWPSRYADPLATRFTDASGVYHIPAVPKPESGPHCIVAARFPGYNGNSIDPVPLDGPVDALLHLDPIVLKPADQVVSGIVVDTEGHPIPNVLVGSAGVYQEDARQPCRQTATDGDGRFYLDGLCAGPVEVGCWAPLLEPSHGYTNTVGGDRHVKIVLGQTLDFAKYWADSRLPDWETLGLSGLPDDLEGKAVLLCLVDLQQRPSRHCLRQLTGRAEELNQRGVAVVIVPLSDGQSEIASGLGVAHLDGNPGELKKALGVQSLPWLVLSDRKWIVVAEGFVLTDLDAQLEKLRRRR